MRQSWFCNYYKPEALKIRARKCRNQVKVLAKAFNENERETQMVTCLSAHSSYCKAPPINTKIKLKPKNSVPLIIALVNTPVS